MAASYSVPSAYISTNSIRVYVDPDLDYLYYRIFIRLSSDSSDETHDEVYLFNQYGYATITGLEPGTNYTINVGYNNDPSTDRVVAWIGSKTFTTEEEATDYYVRIRYYANGGSGAPSSKTFSDTDPKVPVTISSTIPTRAGYEFRGWSEDSESTVPTYKAGTTYNFTGSAGTTTYNLYAVWRANFYYVDINYDANGGTDAPYGGVVTGTSADIPVTLSSVIPTKEGFAFLGWSTSSTATSADYQPGETYTFKGLLDDVNYVYLYAVWTVAYVVLLEYDANGGTGGPTASKHIGPSSSVQCVLPTEHPTKEGHNFGGWNCNGKALHARQTYTLEGSTGEGTKYSLVAIWLLAAQVGAVYIGGKAYTAHVYTGTGPVNGWAPASPRVYAGAKNEEEG